MTYKSIKSNFIKKYISFSVLQNIYVFLYMIIKYLNSQFSTFPKPNVMAHTCHAFQGSKVPSLSSLRLRLRKWNNMPLLPMPTYKSQPSVTVKLAAHTFTFFFIFTVGPNS